ncbi:MAG: ROK family protein [Syntrophomonadaceae bacterium]|nr:ROK family protein [Syntrophomonadaceae bacterium]
MRELVVGVDLGGTKILAGIVDTNGTILGKKRVPTPVGADPDQVLDVIIDCATELLRVCRVKEEEIRGIAVATPGPLSFPEGVVRDSPNLGWERVNFKEELIRRTGRPVIVEKDTNMAALGEYYFGRQRGCGDLLYITVSTGIGGGIICAGKLYRGHLGGAGEVGHMVVEAGGAACNCGRRGCLEALASGSAITRRLDEMVKQGQGQGILNCTTAGEQPGPRELGIAARQGDEEARLLLTQVAEYLGIGIANLVNIFNPRAVILGGGMMLGLKDLLLAPVQNYVYEHVFNLNREDLIIECTSLDDDIVLYGCVAAVLKLLGQGTCPSVPLGERSRG